MSNPQGTALRWRKASRSSGTGSECVEVANLEAGVAVRDSKNPTGGTLTFGRAEWRTFAARARSGELD